MKKILGKKEQILLNQKQKEIKMPHSELKRYEILSKVYKLKDELHTRQELSSKKVLADEYLNKVLDYIGEFTY